MKRFAAWVADRELWLLAPAVAMATFVTRLAPWGLGLIAVLWLVRWIARGRPSVRTCIDLPAILLLLTIPVTLWASTDRAVSLTEVYRLLGGLALAYGLANWARSEGQVALLALGLPAVGAGLALLAPLTIAWPSAAKVPFVPAVLYERLRAFAGLLPLGNDTVHANMMAGALVMLLPFPLAALLARRQGKRGHRVSARRGTPEGGPLPLRLLDSPWVRVLWFGTCALLILGVLVLTKSRGAWIAAAVVLLAVLARRWPWVLGAIPLGALGVGWLAWQGRLPALLDAISAGGTLAGWNGRAEVWSRAIYMIQDFPFTGVGAGTFGRVANVLYPFFLVGPDALVPHAHNLALQVAVDLGIPGLVACAALLLLALWCALYAARSYRRAGQGPLSALAWAGFAGLVGMSVHGLVDATTWIVGRGSFVPWLVIGTLLALVQVHVRPGTRAAG